MHDWPSHKQLQPALLPGGWRSDPSHNFTHKTSFIRFSIMIKATTLRKRIIIETQHLVDVHSTFTANEQITSTVLCKSLESLYFAEKMRNRCTFK